MVGKRHQGSRPCPSLVYLRQIGTIIPAPELPTGILEGHSLILFNHNLMRCVAQVLRINGLFHPYKGRLDTSRIRR